VALGPVLTANVLYGADVATLDDDIRGVVVAVQDGAEMRALVVTGEGGRVVRRPGQQNRSAFRSVRHQDHSVQLDTVAHWNHYVAGRVIEGVGDGLERTGRFTRQPGVHGLMRRLLSR